MGALALLALQMRALRCDAPLLAAALALSSLGDILLDIDQRFFPAGLAAFLLAHLTYIVLFVRNRARPFRAGMRRSFAVLAAVGASGALSAWIVPSVGNLAVPVILYICAITAMVSAAILTQRESSWVPAGALFFLLSDSLLAINKFKNPVPLHAYLVWGTYYLAQCGIAMGFLLKTEKAFARQDALS